MTVITEITAVPAPTKSEGRRADIPTLTGLRFLAAFSVAVAHGASISFQMADAPPEFAAIKLSLETCAAFGMTLFFVLSGFVIHYNYCDLINERLYHGSLQFFWARFSRLYPLFVIVLAADLVLGSNFYNSMLVDSRSTLTTTVRALPYFLTFTQSWIYRIIGDHSIIYDIGTTVPVTWSISTEWFFYFCYPAVMFVLIRATKPLYAVFAALIWTVAWSTFAWSAAGFASGFDTWAGTHFGPIATSSAPGNQDGFVRWLLYFSPYLRIGEFILGCITAQVYLTSERAPIKQWERRASVALLAAAIISIPVLMFVMYRPGGLGWIRSLGNNFGLAPSIALLLFCAARYRPAALRVFSSRVALKLGEASYSIYLTHLLIFSVFVSGTASAPPPTIEGEAYLVMRLVFMLMVVLLVSLSLYAFVEDPSRHILRGLWARPGPFIRPATLFSAPLAFAIAVFGVGHVMQSSANARFAASSGISVTSASYGLNCGAPKGNVTPKVRAACEGNLDCSYIVDVARLGDPAQGCPKAFSVEFLCAPDKAAHMVDLPGEAGLKSVAHLRCEKPRG